MQNRDIVVIGASAGGLNALIEIASALPEDLEAAYFMVLHLPSSGTSKLPSILSRAGRLKAVHPRDGEIVRNKTIYVAPPDYHMLLEDDRILVKKGPKENRFRPAIDTLFRSAAYTYGPRAIGIVLSGMLNDGTSGMWSIKRFGGISIIQDPGEAMFDSMPENVKEYVDVDHSLCLAQIVPKLEELCRQRINTNVKDTDMERKRLRAEIETAGEVNSFENGTFDLTKLTPFTCPECNGVLSQIQEGKIIRFRCHTGHAYSTAALMTEISETVEMNLWKTIKSLEEGIMLLESSAKDLAGTGNKELADDLNRKAKDMAIYSETLHEIVYRQPKIKEEILEEYRKSV
jgi:two-component system chemotaxis response regulator CheB